MNAFCRAEKEYSALSKQLTRELEEKRKVIQALSKQLEEHQKDFNELKAELSKVNCASEVLTLVEKSELHQIRTIYFQAKRKQTYLEDSFSSCVKELQLLSDSFTVDDVINTVKKRSQGEFARLERQIDIEVAATTTTVGAAGEPATDADHVQA